MIRINLLKPLQAQRPMTLVETGGKGKRLAVWAAVVLVVAGVAYFLTRPKSPTMATVHPTRPTVAAHPAAAPTPTPKPITADAVEEIVRQAQTDLSGMSSTPTYADLAPSQRIAYQNDAGAKLLRDLGNATPVQVGFAQIIFTPPDEFYLHGLSESPGDLAKFQSALAAAFPGAEIRSGFSRPVGAAKTAREFSLFVKMKYTPDDASLIDNHVVARNQLNAALQGFAHTAQALGVSVQTPRLEKTTEADGLKRLVYRTEAQCDYSHLQELLEKMHADQSDVGLVRLALESHGDDHMVASLDLLVYAQ